jgi:hypothetical protein
MESSKTNTCGVEDKFNTDSTDQDNKRYKRVKKEHSPKNSVQSARSTLLIRQSKEGYKVREKEEKIEESSIHTRTEENKDESTHVTEDESPSYRSFNWVQQIWSPCVTHIKRRLRSGGKGGEKPNSGRSCAI